MSVTLANRFYQALPWITAGMALIYILAGIVLPQIAIADFESLQPWLFGFSQLKFLLKHPMSMVFLIALSAGVFFFLMRKELLSSAGRLRTETPIAALLAAGVLSAALFFIFRSNYINPDGMMFGWKFAQDIPLTGAHVTHDEMWELYLHSRFWVLTNQYFQWSVELSYQVLSSLAGGVFIMLLLAYSRRLSPQFPLAVFLLLVSGGYMQLFFGEVENYSLTAVWILAYFLASHKHLELGGSILWPSLLLGIAFTFHMLAGFLIPSLLYLLLLNWRAGRRREASFGVGVFVLVVIATLVFFHFNGLQIQNLWFNSYASGFGGHYGVMLSPFSLSYHVAVLNLLFLLVPAWIFLLPLLKFRLILRDRVNTHLVIASAGMAILLFFWEARIGVYNDWNLYAAVALPVSFLVWRNVISVETSAARSWALPAAGFVFFLHSYAWILGNHYL